jgi:hypothetical protein
VRKRKVVSDRQGERGGVRDEETKMISGKGRE